MEAEFDDISPIIAQKAEVAGQSTDNTSQDKEVTDNVSEKSDEKTQVEENAKQPEKKTNPLRAA